MSVTTQDDAPIPILERAKQALSAKSDYELSKQLGISTSAMSGYRKRQSLPMEQCIKIAERTGVSLDWLILGKGEMKGGSGAAEFDDADAVWVPLYDVEVSAGSGIEVYGERIIQRVPFAKSWLQGEGLHAGNLACLPVHGDSMEPTLQHGDIVLVNHEKTRGDGVFVIRMGNALRVKRLQWLANGDLRISSDNDIYEPEQVNPDDLGEQFAILAACHTRISRVG
ncbi:LexA family transcriptional regulator [Neisseria elongata]